MLRLFTPARAAVLVAALIAGVWPAIGGAQDAQPSRGESPVNLSGSPWRIVEVSGARALPDARIVFSGGTISGSAGCNRFFAPMSTGSVLGVGAIQTTLMMCAGRMEGERAVLDALRRIKSASRVNDGVELRDGSGLLLLRLTR